MNELHPDGLLVRAESCRFCFNDAPVCNEVFGLLSFGDDCVPSYAVHCLQCGARGPIEYTPELAVKAWNLREMYLTITDNGLELREV